ncbi:hypothetical protein L9F63_013035, partial [Diploptera punctata]
SDIRKSRRPNRSTWILLDNFEWNRGYTSRGLGPQTGGLAHVFKGTHLRLRPANDTVYDDVCVAQYCADSTVLPVEFFAARYAARFQTTSVTIGSHRDSHDTFLS